MDIIPNMESELAYSFKSSWSPPASPSRDHYMGHLRPKSPTSPRTHKLKTVIRSSTPSPRRSPVRSPARPPYGQSTKDETQLNPSIEAEKREELNDMGEKHVAVESPHAATLPEWNDNVRWEDCVAFASEVELSPREHTIEWLTHTLKDNKCRNPLHWPTLKERTSPMKGQKVAHSREDPM